MTVSGGIPTIRQSAWHNKSNRDDFDTGEPDSFRDQRTEGGGCEMICRNGLESRSQCAETTRNERFAIKF